MAGTCKRCGSIEGALVLEDNSEPCRVDKVGWTRTGGTCSGRELLERPLRERERRRTFRVRRLRRATSPSQAD
jgi:hypothetical protein